LIVEERGKMERREKIGKTALQQAGLVVSYLLALSAQASGAFMCYKKLIKTVVIVHYVSPVNCPVYLIFATMNFKFSFRLMRAQRVPNLSAMLVSPHISFMI
jgi:hypothetical protein